MKKFLLLFAAAVTALSVCAQNSVTFGIYDCKDAMGGKPGEGPVIGMAGYVELGSAAYDVSSVSSDGKVVYTIKTFLGGSDYSFTFEEKPNTPGSDQRLGNLAEIYTQGSYTFSPDYTVFKKDGKDSFRAKVSDWANVQTNSRLSADGKKLYFRRNVQWNSTMEQSENGTAWKAFPKPTSNSGLLIAAIIPIGENDPSGLDEVIADENAPVEYFNLQGLRVSDPQPGQMVIRRQGSKVSKIIVR
jgi:hypothetical protein